MPKHDLNPIFVASHWVLPGSGSRYYAFIEVYAPYRAKYLKTYPTERGAKTGVSRAANKAFRSATADEAKLILNAWREEVSFG